MTLRLGRLQSEGAFPFVSGVLVSAMPLIQIILFAGEQIIRMLLKLIMELALAIVFW